MYSWWAILRWILVGLLASVSASESCGYPGSPAHAVVDFTDEVIGPGTVAQYSCEAGFELLGPTRRVCNENGTWTPPGIPFCVLNVAAGKAPMQSSVVGTGIPQKGVDGSTSTFFNADTCTMTAPESSPWWYVNLLEPYVVQLVRVDFGMSCCSNNRPATIVVRVGNNRPDIGVNPICNKFTGFLEEGRPLFLPCSTPMPGAFVSIHFESPAGNPLSICEAFVYTDQALPIERCPSFRDQPLGSTSTYNGKCYLFYNNQPSTFETAKRFCEIRGGSLVDETSPALQGFISWELFRRHRSDPNGQYWLGAVRDPEDKKNWKWINGKDVTTSFWNLPGSNENCSRFDGAKGWLWSDTNCELNLNFICQHRPTTCGAPERAANSTILARNFEIGSVIEYRCSPGHLLIGPNIRTCLPNGFFSEFPPKCRYLECGPPAAIANGAYNLPNDTRYYLSSVKYSCDEGFVLVGRGHLVCDVDERWNGPPPRCEAVLCTSPPPVSHGGYTLSSNSTTFGTKAEYSCEPGYSIAGKPVLSCLSSGFWDGEAPVCEQDPGAENSYEVTPPPNYVVPSTIRTHSVPEENLATAEHIPVSIYTRRPSTTVSTTTFSYIPTTTTTSKPPFRSSMFPTWKPPFLQKSTTEVPILTFSPEDNEIPDETLNIRTIPGGHHPGDSKSRKKELPMSTTAKLNMGGIIALGVFGGFVFLAAIITVIVIIVRRTRHKRSSSSDNTTISTYDSGSHGEHGLHKYYRRAWENLRYDGKSSAFPPLKSDHTDSHHAHHPRLDRQETLDHPHVKGNGRNTIEGIRDHQEIVVNDVTQMYSRPDKKRQAPRGGHDVSENRQRSIQDWYNKQLGSRQGRY